MTLRRVLIVLLALAVGSSCAGTSGNTKLGVGTRNSSANLLLIPIGHHYDEWNPATAETVSQFSPLKPGQPIAVATTATAIYWLGGSRVDPLIRTASLQGGASHTILQHAGRFASLLTVDHGHLYWTVGRSISRARINGTHVQPHYLRPHTGSAGDAATGLAASGGYLFLSQCDNDRIGRVRTVDPGVHPTIRWIVHRARCAQALAVHGSYVYWAGGTVAPVLGRAASDGRGLIQRKWVHLGRFEPVWMVASSAGLYWTAGQRPSYLGYVSLDGSGLRNRVRKLGDGPIGVITAR